MNQHTLPAGATKRYATRASRQTASPLTALGILAALVFSSVLAGCATPADARKDANFQSYAPTLDRPTQRPTRSLSSFSESLMCMDRMLRAAELPTTLIASKNIPDYSTKVPVGAKDMVITALSQMSRLSNAFRYVDYEVNIVQQDTVQNLTTILLNNNQLQLQRPALYISGAISFVDQNVLNNRFDAGVTASRLEAAYSQNRNATIIGLEFHLGDFRTRTLIPGLDSANEVVIGNGGQGLDLAGRIGTYGVQFNVGRDYTQGSGAAVRTLVDLAMIELVGKWAHLPYWQCLTLDQTNPHFQRQLRDWYDEGSAASRNHLVMRSLVSQGYLSSSDDDLAPNSALVRSAVARFQADTGMVVSGLIDFPTYERALRNFVGLDEKGNLARIGWAPTTAEPVSHDSAATAVAVIDATAIGAQTASGPQDPTGHHKSASVPAQTYGGPPEPRYMNMQIENLLLDRKAFTQGEQIFLSLTVSRASYLACYMADARKSVIRLLPNLTSTLVEASANQAVRIPDWMSPNPGFVMDAGLPGDEGVLCVATDTDVLGRMPPPLSGAPFTPMSGVDGLADVEQIYKKVLGEDGFTSYMLTWHVVARPIAPAAPHAAASSPPKSSK
jgi:hypothetical protein